MKDLRSEIVAQVDGLTPSLEKVSEEQKRAALESVADAVSKCEYAPTVMMFDRIGVSSFSRDSLKRQEERGLPVPIFAYDLDFSGIRDRQDTYDLSLVDVDGERFDPVFRETIVDAVLDGAISLPVRIVKGTMLASMIFGGLGIIIGVGPLLLASLTLVSLLGIAVSVQIIKEIISCVRANKSTFLTYPVIRELFRNGTWVPSIPEINLARVAFDTVRGIKHTVAWNDQILDEHRTVFSVDGELDEITRHAMRIMALRTQVCLSADKGSPEEDPILLEGRQLIDTFVDSLTERVAALWLYSTKLDELSVQLTRMRAIEKSMEMIPRFDRLAAQLGSDELATSRLHELAASAEEMTARVSASVAFLTDTLMVPEAKGLEA